jgi:hypothetical protein
MAKTRTPGIIVLADRRLFIDKWYLGILSACVSAPSPRNRLRNDFASRWRGSSMSGNARHTRVRPSPTALRATWLNRVASGAST